MTLTRNYNKITYSDVGWKTQRLKEPDQKEAKRVSQRSSSMSRR